MSVLLETHLVNHVVSVKGVKVFRQVADAVPFLCESLYYLSQ